MPSTSVSQARIVVASIIVLPFANVNTALCAVSWAIFAIRFAKVNTALQAKCLGQSHRPTEFYKQTL